MSGRIHVVGYGSLGREITAQLLAAGRPVRILQRGRPQHVPAGAEFVSTDVLDASSLIDATRGADAIVCALGFPYEAALWERAWPSAMSNLLAACEDSGARFVFADNLYLYGPRTRPLTEDMEPVDFGRKPKARAVATRLWQAAHAKGRVQAVAVRAPDFYGPSVEQSVLGSAALAALARGGRAFLPGNPDLPHDVAHVSDYARAVITLLDAPADAYGQAWHVPCAPTMTLRRHLRIAADALGVPVRLTVLPRLLAPAIGRFVPIVREGIEMQFLFDRPYIVDSSKFRARFWSDPVPLERGLAEAARSFARPAPPRLAT